MIRDRHHDHTIPWHHLRPKKGAFAMAHPKVPQGVAKFASMNIVWGILALASYLVLPWVQNAPADTQKGFCYSFALLQSFNGKNTTTGFCYTIHVAQHGLQLGSGYAAGNGDPVSLLFLLLVLLIPLAAIGVIVLGIIARTRNASKVQTNLNIVAAIVGIVGTVIMFIPLVAEQTDTQQKFIFAAAIVVATAIVSRIQKQLRNLFQDHPTIASVGLLVIAYIALYLASQLTFEAIIVTQVGVWLGLIAFVISLYAAYRTRREAWAARKGKTLKG
jgi:hypothetical protein